MKQKPKLHTILKLLKYLIQTFPTYSIDFFLYYFLSKTGLNSVLTNKDLEEIKSKLVVGVNKGQGNKRQIESLNIRKLHLSPANAKTGKKNNEDNYNYIYENDSGSYESTFRVLSTRTNNISANQLITITEDGTGGTGAVEKLDRNTNLNANCNNSNIFNYFTKDNEFSKTKTLRERKNYSESNLNDRIKFAGAKTNNLHSIPKNNFKNKNIFVVSRNREKVEIEDNSNSDDIDSEIGFSKNVSPFPLNTENMKEKLEEKQNLHLIENPNQNTPEKEPKDCNEVMFSTPIKKKNFVYYT